MSASGGEFVRVLHLGSPTGLYGAERWILALARHLPSSQVESWVAVIRDAPDLEAPLCREAARLGLHTHIFESPGRLSLSAIGQIRRFIRLRGVGILHTHGYKTDIIGYLAARGTKCKIIATPHGWGASPGLRLRLYEGLDRLMLRHFHAVVPLSADLHAGLQRMFGMRTRLSLIPNGIDLAEMDAADTEPDDLASRRARGDFIVGYVGRLDRGKRVDTLIRAFQLLPIEQKLLCVVGEGPDRQRLERIAAALTDKGQVKFLGYREDRVSIMRRFDVFVLPSEREGIPRCLMEAMSLGVPAIATDIPGCRDLVDGASTGLLFFPGREEELSRQIQRLMEDPAMRTRLAKKGREHIRSRHSARAMAASYLSLYARLLRSSGSESEPFRT